ncbi:MAG: Ig-like domain-containing protein, partial [Pseudomonadales bacterium]
MLELAAGESISGTVNASDPEGDPLTFKIENPPARGDLQLTDVTGGRYTYTAPGAFAVEETFRLRVQDNHGNWGFAHFTVRISGTADPGTCATTTALLGATPRQIVVHPRDPSRIAVLTRDGGNYTGVHTSRDGGATWLQSDAMRELDVAKLAFHPTRHGTLFAAVSGLDQAGIKRSDDHGATWRTRLGVEGAHDV